ncbi:MAG: DUF2231 domain-containing protein [Sphingomonas sp.]|uniref:DUF2231 domain-containing protein n=1 Tax=Sphingomonas sp. CD22 TaxID=3100214 RepID=UPI00121A8B2F|nr:DUF2231 domain-containing protein [Sphingomonas sp. CD22]MEA1086178.1 DUF2231 domain-containing protein [Sphingomonas sp. CD22]RZL59506.1 MAG: DUF2231 domain-containing protein [Sphingomonas sp.]
MSANTPSDRAARDEGNPRSTAKLFGHPLHPMLVPFPIVCFVGALITDLAYLGSANVQWSNFSIWLITAGLVMGGLAALTGIIDYAGDRRVRAARPATPHMIINLSVFVIEIVNAFVHSRDGWTAVVPTGLTLSAISVLLLGVSAWLGGSLVYKHRVGVRS